MGLKLILTKPSVQGESEESSDSPLPSQLNLKHRVTIRCKSLADGPEPKVRKSSYIIRVHRSGQLSDLGGT